MVDQVIEHELKKYRTKYLAAIDRLEKCRNKCSDLENIAKEQKQVIDKLSAELGKLRRSFKKGQ
jgi:predicted RNase H-like nuclease (RuvC/YqgF family)